MLPFGVLIPTRNSMALLPRHLETLAKWQDLAREIVVVDSDSTDGTLEMLRAKLTGPNVKFLRHPPGLYQSWNYGIQHLTAPYTYVSTVGDEMSREGLIHLMEVAEKFSADVVVSPPIFVNQSGVKIRANNWPVHDIVQFLELQQPTCFSGLFPFVFALSFLPFAILGSSASNVYRTTVLQENPFPTDFGPNGDGAWGVFNALKIRFAITPRRISYFKKHRKSQAPSKGAVSDGDRRMLEAGLKAVEALMRDRPEMRAEAERLGLDGFIRFKLVVQRWRARLLWHRSIPWWWVLNPMAWYVRRRRDAVQRDCAKLLKDLLARSPAPGLLPVEMKSTAVIPEGPVITDWADWHKRYELSPLLRARLRIVIEQIRTDLHERPPGPIKIISLCAGDGRDVLEALRDHPRRHDVTAWLLDLSPGALERGRLAAQEAGLEKQFRFVHADASLARNYVDIAPVDLVLISGLLGHVPHLDVCRLIENLNRLCRPDACVIWNRHLVNHHGSQQVSAIRQWLRLAGFAEIQYELTDAKGFAVSRARFSGTTAALDPEQVFFNFVGLKNLSAAELIVEPDESPSVSPAP